MVCVCGTFTSECIDLALFHSGLNLVEYPPQQKTHIQAQLISLSVRPSAKQRSGHCCLAASSSCCGDAVVSLQVSH